MQSIDSRWILRASKILLVLSVATWGLFGAMGNLLDWDGTAGSVAAVSAMERFEGGSEDWRATSSPIVIYGGAVFIVAFKSICALLCVTGAAAMWRHRESDAAHFAASKRLAVAGCMIGVFGLFLGWIAIGEGWFEFWRDPGFDGLEGAGVAAFRYGGFIGIIGLLVAQPEE